MTDRRRAIPDRSSTYDLAVIGAGSAGFAAAIAAAEEGAQVALIGHGRIGGTCVNFGCIPSKSFIRAGEAIHHANSASRFRGITAAGRLEDWSALRAQKNELTGAMRQSKYVDLLPAYNRVTYLDGRAKLGNGGVDIDGRHISAGKVILATGAHEHVPPIPGMRDIPYLTSTSAFDLDDLPESMIVLGGGYIGCELAQMFARCGVRVTIVFRSRLLPAGEPEISAALADYFSEDGIHVRKVSGYEQVESTKTGIGLRVRTGASTRTLEAQCLLLAAGRIANSSGLGLAEAGVEVLADGAVRVDERMRTSRAGVYAAGDVTGRDQFVYMAAYGAKIAARNALNGDGLVYDNTVMPAVVFTDPQAASVGLTESAARARGITVKSSVLTLDNLPRALAAHDTRGLIKLVAEAATGKLLGAHILAPEGGDSIQTAALAIKCGLSHGALAEMIFPYLTTVEGLKLAAQMFDKDVSKLSCCAG